MRKRYSEKERDRGDRWRETEGERESVGGREERERKIEGRERREI